MAQNHVQGSTTSSGFSETETVNDSPQSSTLSESSKVPQSPETIPPTHENRTLVLCFDGTGDQFDDDNSNIVKLFTMLQKGNSAKQMVYYQAGIGTYIPSVAITPVGTRVLKALDQAVAWNLSSHVMDGYEFLMQNYTDGDRICIFGFSRGAYTARGLAGMLYKVGLLPACNHQQVPFAYKMYTRTDDGEERQARLFKKTFSINVFVDFLGVWDSVNSVGVFPRWLPYTNSNPIVRTFRQAMALDERRVKFKANPWSKHDAIDSYGLSSEGTTSDNRKTDVEEVWFAGCHCDVGGGSVNNEVNHTLAKIPLRWMIRECFRTKTGIMFIADELREVGIDPASLYPIVKKRPPPLPANDLYIRDVSSDEFPQLEMYSEDKSAKTEEEHELLDAMSPIYDQLDLAWSWWMLETWPVMQHYQKSNSSWKSTYRMNWGRGRYIPRQKRYRIKVHRSVKMRMEAQHEDKTKYEPKASIKRALVRENVDWVD